MHNLAIYLLCRDRPEYFVETLDSIVRQDINTDYEIIISDNSVKEDIAILMRDQYADVKYIRRFPNLSSFDHFSKVIEEVKSKYILIFHDDDVMRKGFISDALYQFNLDESLVATACNATIMIGNKVTKNTIMGRLKWTKKKIISPAEFLSTYLKINSSGPAPFPSYMYKTSAIKNLKIKKTDGGKHSDVAFLLNLVKKGPIQWTSKSLMFYRIHNGSDSSIESIEDRLSLLRFINRTFQNTGIKKELIIDYKYKYWLSWYKKAEKIKKNSIRINIVRKFLIKRSIFLALTRSIFWIKAIEYLNQKLNKTFKSVISFLMNIKIS